MIEPSLIYLQRISDYQQETVRIRSKLQFIPWFRLLTFLILILSGWFFIKTTAPGFIISLIVSLGAFLAAGGYDYFLKQKIKKLDTFSGINQNEINAIQGDYSVFDPGNEFKSEDHPYSNDLDIFGSGSLFQFVNRTSTEFGKKRLAEYLGNAFRFHDEMIPRQQAIRELSGMIDLRQELQAIFSEGNTRESELFMLMDWLGNGQSTGAEVVTENNSSGMKILKWFSFILPAITLACIVIALTGNLHYQVPIVLVLLQLLIVFSFGRKTQKLHQKISMHYQILQKYSAALALIENAAFGTGFSKNLQNELHSHEQEAPSTVIRHFSRLLNRMDSNLNLIVATLLNGLFMFNIHLLFAVEAWRRRYSGLIPKWFEVLAEFDALSGLAAFSFNNPGFVFPEAVEGEFLFTAEQIGHPLIAKADCVRNNIDIRGWKQFCIITGANMSGKSTFLRTIGTNYVLAMTGAPVFAEKFVFTPIGIHSSIRTNDSLTKGESYFYSELKRLKEIILELESGQKKLILLDEILKGTNSSDKQSGSIALVKQLMKYNVVGMFATHDVSISGLIDIYPDHIRNLCFEIQIENDQMEIDYKLRSGVCRNLNASFLMKKMGIVS